MNHVHQMKRDPAHRPISKVNAANPALGRELSGSLTVGRFWQLALLGGLLIWAASPSVGLSLLAFVATVPWLMIVQGDSLPGKRPYRSLYLAGWCYWLLQTQWIRLPHWTAYGGWLVLSAYLAVYVPLFIGLSRVAVHRLRVPLVAAALLVVAKPAVGTS